MDEPEALRRGRDAAGRRAATRPGRLLPLTAWDAEPPRPDGPRLARSLHARPGSLPVARRNDAAVLGRSRPGALCRLRDTPPRAREDRRRHRPVDTEPHRGGPRGTDLVLLRPLRAPVRAPAVVGGDSFLQSPDPPSGSGDDAPASARVRPGHH